MLVSPSLLAANFIKLENEIKRLNEAKPDYLHLDVMDGNFVPNISFGPSIIKSIKPLTDILFDVHLMITNPDQYLNIFKDAGANILTYHYETNLDHNKMIDDIHKLNMKAGLSIKPATNVNELVPYLEKLDLVLVMSVEPGFGGQKFMDSSLDKIKFLKEYKEKNHLNYIIEVDGGINNETSSLVKDAGCDMVVAGTYLFKGDISKLTKELQSK